MLSYFLLCRLTRPLSTRTGPLFPYTTLFRSHLLFGFSRESRVEGLEVRCVRCRVHALHRRRNLARPCATERTLSATRGHCRLSMGGCPGRRCVHTRRGAEESGVCPMPRTPVPACGQHRPPELRIDALRAAHSL